MESCVINQIKLFYLVMKTGGDVFVETLKTLYGGEMPIELYLVNLADVKSNGINNDERELLTNIKDGKRELKEMDITLTYKLIQLTCELETKQSSANNSCVWTKRCPIEKQNCLEHLLFKYKMERNALVHEFARLEKLSNEDFLKRKSENVNHLKAIVDEVGEKVNLPAESISKWKCRIDDDTNMISSILEVLDNSKIPDKNEVPAYLMPVLHQADYSSFNELNTAQNDTNKIILPMREEINLEYFNSDTFCSNFPLENITPYCSNLPSENIEIQVNSDGYDDCSRIKYTFPPNVNNLLDEISSTLKQLVLVNFNEDLDMKNFKTFEKSNRLYWIEKLVAIDVLNNEELVRFWKDYEENLEFKF